MAESTDQRIQKILRNKAKEKEADDGSLSPRASMMSKISCVRLFRAPFGRPFGLPETPG